ncbi:MAG: hypothetical protein H0U17_01935 [Actinobacteria bacterium]|nr:hypothetical protein [Actinomycetota bacterium]
MSRGPGRWQTTILEALEGAGHLAYVQVTNVGLDALGRSMTMSEYRALNRAAWLLKKRGALHLGAGAGMDYRGRTAKRLVAWTCANCSLDGSSEHIPALPCLNCDEPTQRRAAYRDDIAQCERCAETQREKNKKAMITQYPIELEKSTVYYPIPDVLTFDNGVARLRGVS